MGTWVFLCISIWCLFILFLLETCTASIQNKGNLKPGFQGSQMFWIDNDGFFLVSNNSHFAFGFTTTKDVTLFLLVVIHKDSSSIVWSANRGSPVRNSDSFMFDNNGNAYLQRGGTTIWSTGTSKKGVSAMELLDSGNLVLRGSDGTVVWQSFSHPTDTLLPNQEFSEGTKLVSNPGSNNLSYSLEIKSGDMILSAGFQPPQPYWAMGSDTRRIINKDGNNVTSATLNANSWRFYDGNKALLWQLIFDDSNANATWVAVLGADGFITFVMIQGGSTNPSSLRIPEDRCRRPAACDPYYVCYTGNKCQCPSALPSCKFGARPSCYNSKDSGELVSAGDGFSYFALGFVQPFSKTDLNSCKDSCLRNCSCGAMFFHSNSGNCFLFDQIGSMQGSLNGAGYDSYIKIFSDGGKGQNSGGSDKRFPIVIIVLILIFVMLSLLFAGFYYCKKKWKEPDFQKESSEEDNFLEGLSGMPVRFSYKDLETATSNFIVKLGQGGFGSVYQGSLPDVTRVAVKKLEGVGQGKKEFQAEVSIIGSIHHLHLVRLKGFCAEGSHRLLVYEYMANGSLDKWLFRKNKGELMLDWDTRFNIAVGTAKGLAYLHEDCDVKIVHCDIKPENVLLDEHFMAKVSDFGLAKLMTREQSHFFTTLRGTTGYLAPEWITNYGISEKIDVYSYGMLLLELISGRRNYDNAESSEKSDFPSFAFKMMEEGKFYELIDTKLKIDEEDARFATVIKVALWCIQDDMYLRPPMTKVVQMLEGVYPVLRPPTASQLGSRISSNFLSDCNNDAYLSAVRLSGPR
ncbi:G-type lectin S-receptor-like serine/threonine-protein kinase SD2-5 [Olea europaea var. sylvestris]|uniref:G-type lectin S-receptor-like serine/threonine-protein kinase SD2-5 n=1 Tax=Olea europaea var. sylvestris TaxID=158386 RepID=UPI000C1CDE80|nr:G-type lectin S-receptor-like serine/threonine-protein kinase SD2-5 [Olea europaea var. sylvestris]